SACVAALESFFYFIHRRFHLALVSARDFVSVVLEELLGPIYGIVSLVSHFDLFALFLVVLGVRLGIFAHLLNLILRQATARRDRDLLLFAGAEVLRAHMQDAIGINVERNLDLRHAPRSRWNICQMEFPNRLVIARKLPFALEH